VPRKARERSAYGYYHVILRGIDRQNLFFNDRDKKRMIETLDEYAVANQIIILVYCLMDNHIHLLLKINDPSPFSLKLPRFIKQFSSSYVYYFNHVYDRTGHLFQERYHSEPVDTGQYLLTVTRYILQNPEKAGLCSTERYQWSSFGEMFYGHYGICNPSFVVKTANGLDHLKRFVLTKNEDQCLEYHRDYLVDDENALDLIREMTGEQNPLLLALLPKEKRNAFVLSLRKQGVTNAQLSRLTGISRATISRITKSA